MTGIDFYETFRRSGVSKPASLAMTFTGRYGPLIGEILAGVQAYNGYYVQAGFTLRCAESLRIHADMSEKELEQKLYKNRGNSPWTINHTQ